MADPVSVGAGWALWSKDPGSSRDYSLLASSDGPLSGPEFASVLTHFVAGTPPTESGQPSSLPWVTISRVGVAEQPYLGISIQDPAGTVDRAGRPIASTSYFCVPYADLVRAPISYTGLYQELDRVRPQLPNLGHGLIPLSVPALDPAALARDIIDEFGEPAVTAAAAMLLSGPVSIVGSEGTRLEDRLRFLDAVATLLPYGYRTGFTAATWSDSGTRHPIRLAFAARPRQDAGVIRWRAAAATPISGAGAAYRELLEQIREERPSAADLAALIRFLAYKETAPCGFDQPQRAIDALGTFGLPFLTRNEVRDGTADPARIRAVFTTERSDELTADGQQDLLNALIRTANQHPQNWPVIQDWSARVAGGNPRGVLPDLAEACRKLLWAAAPYSAFTRHVAVAETLRILDAFLARVIATPGSRPDLLAGRGAAAELVTECVLSKPDTSAFPETEQILAGNPAVAGQLFAQLASDGQRLPAALAWLGPVLGSVLAPFRTVLSGAAGAVPQSAIGQLADQDVEYVSALLIAADQRHRLDLVLPGFAGWLGQRLLRRGAADPDDAALYWRERLTPLSPGEPQTMAWLDLTLLLAGFGPRFLLDQRNPEDRRRYCDTIAHGWAMLANDLGPAGDDALTVTLSRYLGKERWTGDAESAATVIDLGLRLTEGGQRAQLRPVISAELERAPDAAAWRFAQQWLPRGREKRSPRREEGQPTPDDRTPATRDEQQPARSEEWRSPPPEHLRSAAPSSRPGQAPVLAALGRLRQGAAPTAVAQLCTEAFRDNLRLGDVSNALADSGAVHSGAQAVAVLEELRRALLASPGKPSNVEEWLTGFTVRFADGTFGPQTAEDFRAQGVQSAVGEIEYHIDVLRLVLTAGPEHGPGLPDDRVVDHVARAARSLEELLRDLRKRSGFVRNALRQGRHSADGRGDRG